MTQLVWKAHRTRASGKEVAAYWCTIPGKNTFQCAIILKIHRSFGYWLPGGHGPWLLDCAGAGVSGVMLTPGQTPEKLQKEAFQVVAEALSYWHRAVTAGLGACDLIS